MSFIKSKSKKALTDETESADCSPDALAAGYSMKKKARAKMAEGGSVGGHQSSGQGHTIHIHVNPQSGYDPTQSAPAKHDAPAAAESDKGLNQHGETEEAPGGDDMVDRILRKHFSEGGRVANETEGQGQLVDEKPNEFDDLALRDDLDFSYTDENSGDEDGSKLNQESGDMVDKIMKKRSKK